VSDAAELVGRLFQRKPERQALRKAQVKGFVLSADPAVGSTVDLYVDGDIDSLVEGVGYCARYGPTIGDWVWVHTDPTGLWVVIDKVG
jgi:hypothetical protein